MSKCWLPCVDELLCCLPVMSLLCINEPKDALLLSKAMKSKFCGGVFLGIHVFITLSPGQVVISRN